MSFPPKTLYLTFVPQTGQGSLEPVHVCPPLKSSFLFLLLYGRFSSALSFDFDISSKVGSA
jgi:hypothetical protein